MAIIISPLLRTAARVLSFMLFALTALAAYGGYIPPHIWAFPSLLTLGLTYLAILSFIVAVIWLVCRRFITGGIGIATLLLCWTPLSQAVPMHFPAKAKPGEQTFTLMTYNTLHFEDYENPGHKGTRGLRYLLHSGADIICTQELYRWDLAADSVEVPNRALLDSIMAVYPYGYADNINDVTVISKYPVRKISGIDSISSNKWNYGLFDVNIKGRHITLVNVHMTSFDLNKEERKVLTGMNSRRGINKGIDELKGSLRAKMSDRFRRRAENAVMLAMSLRNVEGPVIICGDFNDVPASWTYRTFIKEGFRDAYVDTNFGPTFTFNRHLMYFHLDQILYRGGLRPLNVKRDSKIKISDHYPLLAEFAFTPEES